MAYKSRSPGTRDLPSTEEWHPSDDDLERYCLDRIRRKAELARLEEHLLSCKRCVKRARETQAYVDAMRKAAIQGNYDRSVPPPKMRRRKTDR